MLQAEKVRSHQQEVVQTYQGLQHQQLREMTAINILVGVLVLPKIIVSHLSIKVPEKTYHQDLKNILPVGSYPKTQLKEAIQHIADHHQYAHTKLAGKTKNYWVFYTLNKNKKKILADLLVAVHLWLLKMYHQKI